MPLINLVIVLVVVGVILWVINSYIPMQSTIKRILNVVSGYCCYYLAVECLRTHRKPRRALKDPYREMNSVRRAKVF